MVFPRSHGSLNENANNAALTLAAGLDTLQEKNTRVYSSNRPERAEKQGPIFCKYNKAFLALACFLMSQR